MLSPVARAVHSLGKNPQPIDMEEILSIIKTHKYHRLQWFLILAIAEAAIVFTHFATLDPDPKNAAVLGYSTARLVMLGGVLAAAAGTAMVLRKSIHEPVWLRGIENRIGQYIKNDKLYYAVISLCIFGVIAGVYTALVAAAFSDEYLKAYLARIAPFALWGAALCTAALPALRELRIRKDSPFDPSTGKVIAFAGAVFSVMALLWAWMTTTGIGLEPDITGWWGPGTPLLPLQVTLAWTIAIIVWATANRISKKIAAQKKHKTEQSLKIPRMDIIIALLVWAAAAIYWNATPQAATYFSPTPRPPNFEYYPFSDAAGYDTSAQRLLIGEGFENEVRRPLYSFFLAAAQGISGPGNDTVVAWQIIFLAAIPGLIYLLGALFKQRAGGLFTAVLVLLRESQSIALSGIINVSHAKMMMSDLPTMAGVALLTWLVCAWMIQPNARRLYPLMAGGVLGLTALVRSQALFLLPVILLAGWIIAPRQWPRLGRFSLLVVSGLALVITPWLTRNWLLTGHFSMAAPSSFGSPSKMFQFKFVLPAIIEAGPPLYQQELGDFSEYLEEESQKYILANPLQTVKIIGTHFMHSQIDALLALPAEFSLAGNLAEYNEKLSFWTLSKSRLWKSCCSTESYISDLGYWDKWDGNLSPASALPLLLNAGLVSLGISAAWKRHRGSGIFPLLVYFGYSFSSAAGRFSGWRFILPVDWIIFWYYAAGIMQLTFWVFAYFRGHGDVEKAPPSPALLESSPAAFPMRQAIVTGIVFFTISLSIPLAERFIPDRFPDDSTQDALEGLTPESLASLGVTWPELNGFLKQESAIAVTGRGLYPRFYPAGEGEPGSFSPSLGPREYHRLGFILIGRERYDVVLPTNRSPGYFPHTADVLVLGCMKKDHVEARAIILLENPAVVVMPIPNLEWTCAANQG